MAQGFTLPWKALATKTTASVEAASIKCSGICWKNDDVKTIMQGSIGIYFVIIRNISTTTGFRVNMVICGIKTLWKTPSFLRGSHKSQLFCCEQKGAIGLQLIAIGCWSYGDGALNPNWWCFSTEFQPGRNGDHNRIWTVVSPCFTHIFFSRASKGDEFSCPSHRSKRRVSIDPPYTRWNWRVGSGPRAAIDVTSHRGRLGAQ